MTVKELRKYLQEYEEDFLFESNHTAEDFGNWKVMIMTEVSSDEDSNSTLSVDKEEELTMENLFAYGDENGNYVVIDTTKNTGIWKELESS